MMTLKEEMEKALRLTWLGMTDEERAEAVIQTQMIRHSLTYGMHAKAEPKAIYVSAFLKSKLKCPHPIVIESPNLSGFDCVVVDNPPNERI